MNEKGIKRFKNLEVIYSRKGLCKNTLIWAVVVAQLVEQSLPIPEVRGSNPVISKNLFIYIEHLFTVNCVLKR